MAEIETDVKKALLEALLEEDRVVRRMTTDAANDDSRADTALDAALRDFPTWWFPTYKDEAPSRARWLAFAEKRRSFAKGMRDLALLTLLLAVVLPTYVDRWLFCGFSLAIAFVWAWQLDIANREIARLTALPGWRVGSQVPHQGDAVEG